MIHVAGMGSLAGRHGKWAGLSYGVLLLLMTSASVMCDLRNLALATAISCTAADRGPDEEKSLSFLFIGFLPTYFIRKLLSQVMDSLSHPALLLVDGVSSIGGLDFQMDAWKVDMAVTGSQKALSLPTGLALVAASPKVPDLAARIRHYRELFVHCCRTVHDYGSDANRVEMSTKCP